MKQIRPLIQQKKGKFNLVPLEVKYGMTQS